MLKKITGRYNRGAQVKEFTEELERMITEYGWQDKFVHPYSYAMPLTKILGYLKDYHRCTEGSKDYIVTLANWAVEMLNSWEEYEKAPKIAVRVIKTGQVLNIMESDLDMFEGLVERI